MTLSSRRTNCRILALKKGGTNKGHVVLWVIKVATVASQATKLDVASTGSKSFALKLFCLSVFR